MKTLLKFFWKKILAHKILSLILAAVVLYGGYYAYGKLTSPAAVTQYVTAAVEKGTLVIYVSGSGQISASNQTNIQAQVSGIVSKIYVDNNQPVKTDQLLIKLDTTNDERAVRNAEANLENAKLSLKTLEQPASTSTILQARQSAVQSQQSFQTYQNNLASDYTSAYADVSNAFIDLPGVMTGLNNVLFSTTVNKIQWNVDAYSNMISALTPKAELYNQSAVSSYQAALSAYNQGLADFKNSTINSNASTTENILAETYNVLKAISVANSNVKNLLDIVNDTLQQNNLKIPSQLSADETSMQAYITATNTHLSNILQMQNSIQSDKQSIVTGNLAIQQTAAALQQLESGPTALQLQMQQLSVTQAENALSDAKENLNNDYIRAPFDGIITNIAARVDQPAAGALATLVSNAQLAQATLNEVDVVNVKLGQKAIVTFDALPNLTATGKVVEIDTLGTITQGVVSYNIKVALDISNPEIKPGMSDTVSVITNVKQDVLLAPNSAITTKQNNSFVQIMEANGVPTQVQVTTGLSNDSQTEIISGLNEGDKIVIRTITAGAGAPTQTTGGGLGGIRIPGLGGGGRPD